MDGLNCEQIKRKLFSYIDEEINIPEKDIISNHIKNCQICKGELTVLVKQKDLLVKLKDVEVSSDFRAGLLRKVKEWDDLKQENEETIRKTHLNWLLPVPAIGVIVFISIFAFTLFLPFAYGVPQEKKQESLNFVIGTFSNLHQKSILAPVNLINYCKSCCEIICKCYQEKNNKGCICGGCENGH